MRKYPSTPRLKTPDQPKKAKGFDPEQLYKIPKVYMFDKLDGSNIRAQWKKNKGFVQFGSRYTGLDKGSGVIYKAKDIIIKTFQEDLSRVFTDKGYKQATAFFEFFGTASFAGDHSDSDYYSVYLLDVAKQSGKILGPEEFVQDFGHLRIPELLHVGPISPEIVDSVRSGEMRKRLFRRIGNNLAWEGVVCKADMPNNQIARCKIKTDHWIDETVLLRKAKELMDELEENNVESANEVVVFSRSTVRFRSFIRKLMPMLDATRPNTKVYKYDMSVALALQSPPSAKDPYIFSIARS